jgi:hypothetical protein
MDNLQGEINDLDKNTLLNTDKDYFYSEILII